MDSPKLSVQQLLLLAAGYLARERLRGNTAEKMVSKFSKDSFSLTSKDFKSACEVL